MLTVGSRNRTSTRVPELSSSRTRVCVLVREKGGRSPVLCKIFSHVEPAEAFIQGRLASGARQGFMVFWTLLGEPTGEKAAEGQRAEVMVLIPEKKADSVLPFAFPDLKTARAFVQRRYAGRDASITWTVPIGLSTDVRGTVSLSPSTPPETATAEMNATFQTDVQEALSYADEPEPETRIQEAPPTPLMVEVCKVLAVKRWEFIPGSFAGFGSPPGRF